MSQVIYLGHKRKEITEEEWDEYLFCGLDGWSHLIKALIDDLFELGWDGHLFDIKEKYGSLRFYIGAGSTEIHDRIAQAEQESISTCIECGAPGRRLNYGWVLTLCPKHAVFGGKRFELLDTDSTADSSAV